MSIVFSGGDLINIAIDIERRGIMFYDIMAKSTDNEDARAVFEGLVEMERQHIKIFEDMLGEADKHQPREASSTGYSEYLQAILDDAVFTDDMITSEMATQADSDIKALELGMRAEKDSILFYYEMRDSMPRRTVTMFDRIIAEEKSHLQQLSEIKKKLAAS
ncbi:MAG: ferritin family protein [Dehalococcoidales bacterium]|nr:ferritin family protein [Dehalococcoidales bacterium]